MAESYIVTHRRYDERVVPGKRLGRHVLRDSRSAAYPYRAPVGAAIVSVLHERHVPILDQGDVGSCTGNAETGALGTSPVYDALPADHPALNEDEALRLYAAATKLDGYPGIYPPDDTGSDGTSVSKAAAQAGLISGYTHPADVNAVLAALMAGPVILGIDWFDSFDSPDASGLVAIGKGASIRGGHEIAARGVDADRKLILLDNSWGTSWGAGGSFSFSWDTLDRLLSTDGDAVVPVPLSAPAPVPVPVPVADADHALWATAGPWCSYPRTRPDLVELKGALTTWASSKGVA